MNLLARIKIILFKKNGKYSKYSRLLINYIRHYGDYRKTLNLLNSKFFFKKEDIEAYQFNKLKEIIGYAYKNVPYYQELFDKISFHPDQFMSMADFTRIPYLTKNLVRENHDKLVSRTVSQNDIKVAETGGTTGMPMTFYLNKNTSSLIEMAYLRHIWKRVGFKPYQKCIVLREDSVSNIVIGKNYWKLNYVTNWLTMSSFHLNADTFELYYQKIIAFKPKFIIAFPSNAYLLARFIKEKKLSGIPSLKGVICSSENMYDWQRKYMEEVFKVRIFSYYGHSEKAIIAAECEDSHMYEFYPQYGFVELINQSGEPCKDEDERGEIVVTGFNSLVTPFIRYKTEDIGIYTHLRSKKNPNWFTIKSIEGRKQDFIVDSDNTLKTSIHVDRPFWDIRDIIYAYQYIQDTPGKLLLTVHAKEKLTQDQIDKIKRLFYEVHFKFELEVKQVDNIPRTRSGKFKYLIQNIKNTN